jgi:hypothetical protein
MDKIKQDATEHFKNYYRRDPVDDAELSAFVLALYIMGHKEMLAELATNAGYAISCGEGYEIAKNKTVQEALQYYVRAVQMVNEIYEIHVNQADIDDLIEHLDKKQIKGPLN